MQFKELVNKMIRDLEPGQRQQFYEEYARQKAKGGAEETAIGDAFKKIGIADPFTTMKITLKEGSMFGIHKKEKVVKKKGAGREKKAAAEKK